MDECLISPGLSGTAEDNQVYFAPIDFLFYKESLLISIFYIHGSSPLGDERCSPTFERCTAV